jgi:hypothetical protein
MRAGLDLSELFRLNAPPSSIPKGLTGPIHWLQNFCKQSKAEHAMRAGIEEPNRVDFAYQYF